jgi:molecular chaperone DnaJ
VHKNYYEILGLSKDASADDIKKQYRKLSKQYHPDINPEGETKFKDIAEAYSVLGDEQKRNQYDNPRMNPFGGSGGGVDFDEFLRNMGFGGNPFANGGPSARRAPSVPDTIIEIKINPIDSYLGGKKEITYQVNDGCNECNNTGGDRKICSTCKGQGFITRQMGTGLFNTITQHPCPTCKTTGYEITNPCYSCNGKGVKPKMQTLSINLPVGSDDGDFLRVGKNGHFYPGHGKSDLIIKVSMQSENGFQKMGQDLVYTKRMSNLEFLFEEKIIIPHPDGELSILKPNGIDTEKPLRLKHKGYKINGVIGNMYLKIVVFDDDKFDKDKIQEMRKIYLEQA